MLTEILLFCLLYLPLNSFFSLLVSIRKLRFEAVLPDCRQFAKAHSGRKGQGTDTWFFSVLKILILRIGFEFIRWAVGIPGFVFEGGFTCHIRLASSLFFCTCCPLHDGIWYACKTMPEGLSLFHGLPGDSASAVVVAIVENRQRWSCHTDLWWHAIFLRRWSRSWPVFLLYQEFLLPLVRPEVLRWDLTTPQD